MVGIGSEKFSGQPEIMVEHVVGVSPFIITPDGFFVTVEELRTKRLTGKTAGMRSAPMETVQPGETDQEALERLSGEEVTVPELSGVKPGPLLCRVQFRPGVWLHAYLFWGHKNFSIKLGSETDEVARPDWTRIEDVLTSKPSERRFRPGIREMVKSYIAYLEEGENFKPRVFFSCEDTVPEEVFDELERRAKQA